MAGKRTGGWVEEPRLKSSENYLTNPVWVGDAVPGRYVAYPWGFGGECWWVLAYRGDPRDPARWRRRKVFAGMDPDALTVAARQWAEGDDDGR